MYQVHVNRVYMYIVPIQVGAVLQFPLARQVTVADPDKPYPVSQKYVTDSW